MIRRILFFSMCCLLTVSVSGQLNCKTTTNNGKVKKCFHRNGQISTLETWDQIGREGSMKGFDPSGKELFSYSLRTFAGHSSVYLDYYTNGQVKKAEYSSAPDGGIQFYHIIHQFDEQGNQTSKMDLSRPDVHDVLYVEYDTAKIKKTVIQVKPVVTVQKPVYTTVFKIANETGKTMDINLVRTFPNLKDTLITLKRGTEIVIDSIRGESFVDHSQSYQPLILSRKAKKRYKKILSMPADLEKRRTYTWHILEAF